MSEPRVEIPENFNFASLTFDMSRDGTARLLWYIRRTREISGEGIETRVELDNFVNLLLNHLERMDGPSFVEVDGYPGIVVERDSYLERMAESEPAYDYVGQTNDESPEAAMLPDNSDLI